MNHVCEEYWRMNHIDIIDIIEIWNWMNEWWCVNVSLFLYSMWGLGQILETKRKQQHLFLQYNSFTYRNSFPTSALLSLFLSSIPFILPKRQKPIVIFGTTCQCIDPIHFCQQITTTVAQDTRLRHCNGRGNSTTIFPTACSCCQFFSYLCFFFTFQSSFRFNWRWRYQFLRRKHGDIHRMAPMHAMPQKTFQRTANWQRRGKFWRRLLDVLKCQ